MASVIPDRASDAHQHPRAHRAIELITLPTGLTRVDQDWTISRAGVVLQQLSGDYLRSHAANFLIVAVLV